MSKQSNYAEVQHKALHHALPVYFERDEAENIVRVDDSNPGQYNLFRGSAYGDGHADRLLDDFLALKRKGLEPNPDSCSCSEYASYLKRTSYATDLPPFCVRRRILKAL